MTLKADAPAVFRQVKQGKHLPGHFENQGGVIKRKALGDAWFGNAIYADLFDVMEYNLTRQLHFLINFIRSYRKLFKEKSMTSRDIKSCLILIYLKYMMLKPKP